MSCIDLFGNPYRIRKKKKKKKTDRTQNRRAPWEDAVKPTLLANSLFEHLKVSQEPPGKSKVSILAERHALGLPLWMANDKDAKPIIDEHCNVLDDARLLEAFTKMFFSNSIKGVYWIHDRCYRVYPWCKYLKTFDKKTGQWKVGAHIHVKRYTTIEDATLAYKAWHEKHSEIKPEDFEDLPKGWDCPVCSPILHARKKKR